MECKYCKKKFNPISKRQKYCQAQCVKNAWNKRNSEYLKLMRSEYDRRYRKRHPEKVYLMNKEYLKKKGRTFSIWNCMKQRCYNKNSKDYSNYGGRGIIICDEWLNSFDFFNSWARKNGYADNLTIDRINVNDIYKPDNCRWITIQEQQKNRRKKDL